MSPQFERFDAGDRVSCIRAFSLPKPLRKRHFIPATHMLRQPVGLQDASLR